MTAMARYYVNYRTCSIQGTNWISDRRTPRTHSLCYQRGRLVDGEWAAAAGGKCGAGGGSRTLTGLLSPADFLTDHGFRRPERFRPKILRPVCGLDYPFTVPR